MITSIQFEKAITQQQYDKVAEFLKSIGILVKEKQKDDTKMSKEDFFSMIDKARKQPSRRMSREERKAFLGV